MIGVGEWWGGVIRPAMPNVVKRHRRALPYVLASLRRLQDARPRPTEPSRAVAQATGPEDHDRDRDLMRRVCEHDEDGLTALYDIYAPVVHGLATSILRDPALAEEATHDVFLRLWQQPTAFDPARGAFAGWLMRVTRNRCIDLIRRRREKTSGILDADVASWLVDPEPGPEEQALAGLRRDEVRKALQALSPDHRHLLELAYFTGLSQSQIATRLDRPLGTVKSQIRTAMSRLADQLAPHSESHNTGESR